MIHGMLNLMFDVVHESVAEEFFASLVMKKSKNKFNVTAWRILL